MYVSGHKRDRGAVPLEVYTINKATDNHGKEVEIVGQALEKISHLGEKQLKVYALCKSMPGTPSLDINNNMY